jgi:hypothetical protein
MASTLIRFEDDDFDAWKQVFGSDPAGHSRSATSHTVSRGVDDLDSGALRQFGPGR